MRNSLCSVAILLTTTAGAMAATSSPATRPTIYLIGDSTVRNGSGNGDGGLWGWGAFLADHFDSSRIRIVNRALGGRSSRTFLTEGLWDRVLKELRPGDFVFMQFGHNDGGPLDTGRARASLKGNGDEDKEVVPETTGKRETVHTYGWYLRKYIADVKAKGATPIVLSPVPRNMWMRDGKVARASDDYGKWAAQAAKSADALFIDLNELVASRYEQVGKAKVENDYFTSADHTHTTADGAKATAAILADAIRQLRDCPLGQYLTNPR